MQVKQVFVLGAMALATGATFAQVASNVPLTRAQVKREVLQARASGDLLPAGDFSPSNKTYSRLEAAPSSRTRGQLQAEVVQARASGDLLPAGDFSPSNKTYSLLAAAPSSTTREQMKAEVLEARAEGALIPAGEGAFLAPESTVRAARQGGRAHEVFARGAK